MEAKMYEKKIVLIACFSVFLLFALMSSTRAQPDHVNSVISQNTPWTLANSPYIVTDNILVESNVTLTIEPGVIIKFDGYYQIVIKGDSGQGAII